MALSWMTTGYCRTRVLFDGDKRVGHVRNAGNKVWRCEYYPTGELKDMDSLVGGKTWLEMHHKMQ